MAKSRKGFWRVSSFFVLVSVLCNITVNAGQKEVTGNNSERVSMDFPEVYEEEGEDGLSFQADVFPPRGLQPENEEIQVTYTPMDFEKALEELFSNVEIVEKEETILQPENSLYQWVYGSRNELLTNSSGMLRMEKSDWGKVKTAIELSPKSLEYNADLYTTPQEFDFGTAEDAWEELHRIIQNIGVKSALEPTIFYMDYQTMEEQDELSRQRNEDRAGEEAQSWSELDNGYYISAVQCVDGNTVFANTYFGSGIEGKADTANVQAYINRNGIQMLEITRIIGKIHKTDKKWNMLPFEEVVGAVKKRFSLAITGDQVEVQEFRFSYMTEAVDDETYRLIPVWFCNYKQQDQEGNERMRQVIIHAATGEEVLYELY